MSTDLSLIDYEVVDDDHLRLPHDALHDLGEATQVLAAIWTAAGPDQKHATFASHDKLAAIACCSRRTILRAVADDGPLVCHGYLVRQGRQPFNKRTNKVRRTVTLKLTQKAVKAFTEGRYNKLPRVLVHAHQEIGNPLTWAERSLLAFLVNRHTLVDSIEIDGKGCAETRNEHSLKNLRMGTGGKVDSINILSGGLARNSIITARDGLERRGLIVVEKDFDGGAIYGPTTITLNNDCTIPANLIPMRAVDILRGSNGPPKRTWQPALEKGRKRPKSQRIATVSSVSQGVVQSCHSTQCKSDTGVVQTCHIPSANLSLAKKESVEVIRVTNPKKESKERIAAASGSGVSVPIPEKASQGKAASITPKLKSSKDTIDIERTRDAGLAFLATLKAAK